MNLSERIEQIIKNQVEHAETITRYREPLVGFASAHDPLFNQLKEIVGNHHANPLDLLPEAKTVVSFFLPFTEEIIRSNRRGKEISKEWAVAYIETNALIAKISETIKNQLEPEDIQVVTEKATHNFNPVDMTSGWSHRSAAYIAGLGTFGVNHMLITSKGCGGRFGSVIISADIPPSARPREELCRYKREGNCLFCVNNCPTKALKIDSFDKFRCYDHVMEVDASFPDLGVCDVCGKCVVGPCAFQAF